MMLSLHDQACSSRHDLEPEDNPRVGLGIPSEAFDYPRNHFQGTPVPNRMEQNGFAYSVTCFGEPVGVNAFLRWVDQGCDALAKDTYGPLACGWAYEINYATGAVDCCYAAGGSAACATKAKQRARHADDCMSRAHCARMIESCPGGTVWSWCVKSEDDQCYCSYACPNGTIINCIACGSEDV